MPALTAKAPAKLILLGEHAVVYGYPALAVPVASRWLRATMQARIKPANSGLTVSAPQLDIECPFEALPELHPIKAAVIVTLRHLGIQRLPSANLNIQANFPFSSGLGSSASLAVAVIRVFSAFLGHSITNPELNTLAYQVETSAHGTPSGVDNSVVSYNQPIWFIKGAQPTPLQPGANFHFLIADSGIKKSTAASVGELARRHDEDSTFIDECFKKIAGLTRLGRQAFQSGEIQRFGELMNENQEQLAKLGLSCPELDRLNAAALKSGAFGAKLTGGGLGGFMVALSPTAETVPFKKALIEAGAQQVIDVPVLKNPEGDSHE
ncbi:MAG TPA: mevalonate kinase [Anaerolineaceae bacterium]|nr:mevalonate kinase [Anaerolineaceae bacterium]